jgi:GPH family glycoside/pentoside/hexuronide:cation symporter
MSVGGGIAQAVGIYALVYWLGFTQREVGLLIALVLGTACVGLPFWTKLSERIGKDTALQWLLFYEISLRCFVYFLVPYKPLVYAYMVVSGFGIGGLMLILSLLTDVLDTDELETGTRRAGAFLGFWTLVMKGARAAGPVIVGGILAIAGYVPNVAQTPFVIETLRWLYGPIPSLFFVTGYVVFRRFSLTRERVNEVQAELARRRNLAVLATGERG